MKLPPIILASSSPRRSELLGQMGFTFTVIPSDATETHNEDITAREAALVNAYRKARAVAKRHPDSLVIAADTLVYLDSKLFGKPANREDACRMLKQLQGRTHEVVTGVCLTHLRGRRQFVFAESTDVTFHPLKARQITEYLRLVNTLDKAGAYAIQDQGAGLVERVSGSFSNVIGLPVARLREELAQWPRGE